MGRRRGFTLRQLCSICCVTFWSISVIFVSVLIWSSRNSPRPTQLCLGKVQSGLERQVHRQPLVVLVCLTGTSHVSEENFIRQAKPGASPESAFASGSLVETLNSLVQAAANFDLTDTPIHLVVSSGSPRRHLSLEAGLLTERLVRDSLRRFQSHFTSTSFVQSSTDSAWAEWLSVHAALHNGLQFIRDQESRFFPEDQSLFSPNASLVVVREGAVLASDAFSFFKLTATLLTATSRQSSSPSYLLNSSRCSSSTFRYSSTVSPLLLATAAWTLEDHHPQLHWRYSSPIQDRTARLDSKLSPHVLFQINFHSHARLLFHAWQLSGKGANLLLSQLEQALDESSFSSSFLPASSAIPPLISNHCNCMSLGRFVSSLFAGHSFLGPERMRAHHDENAAEIGSGDPDDAEQDPPPLSDQPIGDVALPRSVDDLVIVKPPAATLWQSFISFFPRFRCPDRLLCISPENGEVCGQFRWSTCFDGQLFPPRVSCTPCHPEENDQAELKCSRRFPTCCKNEACHFKTPFFV